MSKERDWVDYAKLGSNIYQNLQLSSLQTSLENNLNAIASAAAVARVEAAETRRIAEEARAKTQKEDNDREVVFQAETNLKDLRSHMESEKAGTLTLATFSLAALERHKLTTASFRTFEDKERLQGVLEGYRSVAAECRTSLSPEEIEEADKCVKYMLDPNDDNFIPAELRQELAQVERALPYEG